MHQYSLLLRVFLTEQIKSRRKALHLTQESMAEKLRISPRSYISLEQGKSGCSAATLTFFLLILFNEDLLQLFAAFRRRLKEEDSYAVA
jgi:transcriptional regulator with XRE-family HTH domain